MRLDSVDAQMDLVRDLAVRCRQGADRVVDRPAQSDKHLTLGRGDRDRRRSIHLTLGRFAVIDTRVAVLDMGLAKAEAVAVLQAVVASDAGYVHERAVDR